MDDTTKTNPPVCGRAFLESILSTASLAHIQAVKAEATAELLKQLSHFWDTTTTTRQALIDHDPVELVPFFEQYTERQYDAYAEALLPHLFRDMEMLTWHLATSVTDVIIGDIRPKESFLPDDPVSRESADLVRQLQRAEPEVRHDFAKWLSEPSGDWEIYLQRSFRRQVLKQKPSRAATREHARRDLLFGFKYQFHLRLFMTGRDFDLGLRAHLSNQLAFWQAKAYVLAAAKAGEPASEQSAKGPEEELHSGTPVRDLPKQIPIAAEAGGTQRRDSVGVAESAKTNELQNGGGSDFKLVLPIDAVARLEQGRAQAELEFRQKYRDIIAAGRNDTTDRDVENLLVQYAYAVFFVFAEEAVNSHYDTLTVRKILEAHLPVVVDNVFLTNHLDAMRRNRDEQRARFHYVTRFIITNSEGWLELQRVLAERAKLELDSIAIAVQPQPQAAATTDSVFHEEKQIWTLSFEGETIRLSDSVGLGYIAELLRHPRTEIEAAALGVPNQQNAGVRVETDDERITKAAASMPGIPMTDAKAIKTVKAALANRTNELENTSSDDQPSRTRLQGEISKLQEYLAQVQSRRGAARTTGGLAARSRSRVKHAIDRAITRIAEQHTPLANHLHDSIRTGTSLVYLPTEVPDWQF